MKVEIKTATIAATMMWKRACTAVVKKSAATRRDESKQQEEGRGGEGMEDRQVVHVAAPWCQQDGRYNNKDCLW